MDKGSIKKSDEIARLSGVSRSTVSRVVNNYPNVTEETRRKVMEVISQYGYTPNTSARSLAGKPMNTIGLFILSITEKNVVHHVYRNSYFAPYLELLVDELNSKGYYVLVTVIYNREDYGWIRRAFSEKRVDGGIVIGTETMIKEFREVLSNGHPMVIIDVDPDETRNWGSARDQLTIVNSMNYEGACEAVEYLISLGHREIGLLAGRTTTCSGRERNKAYMDVMAKHGLPIRHEYIIAGQFVNKITEREVNGMLDRGILPTAIFSTSDEMALETMKVFKARGVRVPEDVSIVGFDDILLSSQVTPALTTVAVPFLEMTKQAVNSMVNTVEGGEKSQSIIRVPVTLVIRDSCQPPR